MNLHAEAAECRGSLDTLNVDLSCSLDTISPDYVVAMRTQGNAQNIAFRSMILPYSYEDTKTALNPYIKPGVSGHRRSYGNLPIR